RRGSCAVKEHFPTVDSGRLAKARTVLAYVPELVDQVIAGTKSLDAAYEEARNRKNAASSVEKRRRRSGQVPPKRTGRAGEVRARPLGLNSLMASVVPA